MNGTTTVGFPDHYQPADDAPIVVDAPVDTNALREAHGRYRRFVVPDAPDALDKVRALADDTILAARSVFVQRRQTRRLVPWKWPVDFALWSGAGGVELFNRITDLRRRQPYLTPLMQAAPVDRGVTADVLLLRTATESVSTIAAAVKRLPSVGLVLSLRTQPNEPEQAWADVERLANRFPSAAVASAHVPDDQLQYWLEGFIRELSHNLTVDVALSVVAESIGEHMPLLSAPPGFMEHARLARHVDALEKRLGQRAAPRRSPMPSAAPSPMPPPPPPPPPSMSIPHGSRAGSVLGIEGPADRADVADRLRSVPRDSGFARETGLATASVEIDAAAPREPATQFLQAKLVTAGRKPVDLPVWTAGETNVVAVRIGPRDPEWPVPAAAREFPVAEVLGEEEEADVSVLCYVPGILAKALKRTITVRRTGASTVARFPVPVPADIDAGSITARIVVTHGGRVVQSGRLRGSVFRTDARTSASSSATLEPFELDTLLRTNIGDLRTRQAFDAALLIEAGSTVIHDIDAAKTFKAPPVLSRLLDHYDRQLTDVAKNPTKYESLDSPASVALLRELAQVGAEIRDQLEEAGLSKDLFKANRIQLVSTTTSVRVPLELFYDGRAPLPEAELCSDWKTALTTDGCGEACSANPGGSDRICPRRFWGFSRIIERHVEGTSSKAWDGDFAVRNEPDARTELHPFRATAIAGSDRITKHDAAALGRLRAKLEQHDGVPAHHQLAADWSEWETAIKSSAPSLLLLMPHTTMQGIQPGLEIGGKVKLVSNIESEHIGTPESRPIVVLLGCETDTNPTEFFDIVSRCRRRGAVIVVAFGATIAVKHALPAAEQLIDQLAIACKADDGATLGDAMLATRRALAANGWVAALGLAAYGDADWRFAN